MASSRLSFIEAQIGFNYANEKVFLQSLVLVAKPSLYSHF